VGILKGGQKLAQEINIRLEQLLQKYDLIKITLCGHSLGGLFIRSALKHIYQIHGDNPSVQWIGIITINSPHLGVRKPGGSFFQNVYKYMIHTACEQANGITGDDLIGLNQTLKELAEEDFITKFKYFTLVGLAHHDLLVPFPTAVICPVNPYPELNYNSGLSVVGCHGFSEQYLELKWENINLSDIVQSHWVMDDLQNYEDRDNYSHSSFDVDMIKRLYELKNQRGNWRRLDLNVGKLFTPVAHDICIKKKVPLIKLDLQPEASSKLLGLFSQILLLDHTHDPQL